GGSGRSSNSMRWRNDLNEGDFDDRFGGFEFHFDQDGEAIERKLESMGEEWEDFGERMGELGMRMGQMFKFDSDGGIFKFDFGRDMHMDLDSLMGTLPEGMRSFRISPNGQSREFFFDSDDDGERELELLLREKERSLQEEEAELERMETMIEKLERRKEEKQKRLEELRRKEGKERKNDQKERNAEIRQLQVEREKAMKERRSELRLRQQEREAEMSKNRRELGQEQEVRRREHEAQLAEIRRDNQERLAEIRREKERTNPNYGSIIEQLQDEGLLPEGELRKLTVDNKNLKFNGSKASKEAHDRFLEIYGDRYGIDKLGDNFKVKVAKY
ncbi:MAG: hypothetical protein AAGA62_04995, partial [Bacteroidota bacterium]